MTLIRRLILAFALMAGISPAIAQPAPVPALPDAERRTSYSISGTTCACSVGFALYGDGTDYGNWVEVFLVTGSGTSAVVTKLTAVTDYVITSPTGPLGSIARPVTDGLLTLTSSRTGTIQIVGARRPRRTSQFSENRGVAARDLNQALTDIVAQNREVWDRTNDTTGRAILAPPAETLGMLPPAAARASGFLCWDNTGLTPLACAGGLGTGNVNGPNVSVIGHIATFGNTGGTLLLDGGLVGAGNVVGPSPSVSVANHAVTWKDTLGTNVKDNGLTLTPSTGTITIANGKTLAADNSLEFAGTDSTVMTFPTTSATIARTDAANTFTGHQTIEGVTSTGATGTGNLVFATAPTLGAVTLTSANKVAITAPASGSTLTIADGKTLTDTSGIGASVLLGATGGGFSAYAGATCTNQFVRSLSAAAAASCASVANTDLTNSSITIGSTNVALGATAATVAGLTLTAPTINGGTAQALTNLGVRSSGTGAFDMVLANSENLTAQRALTLTLNNAARTVNLSGNLSLASDLTIAGGSPVTLTATGGTGVTLPTSGTLATLDTLQTFSAQKTFSALQQFSDVKFSSGKLYPTADSTTALQILKADGTTAFVTFDSTNKRVGINKTPGAFDLDVNGAVNVGSTLTFTTLDPTSLGTSTSTVTGLTVNNSPSSSNDYIPYYSAADGRIRKATVGSIAAGATAGVSSLNGLTGGLSIAQGTDISVSAGVSSVTVASAGFTQKGGSGVNRTFTSKGQDLVNVYDFNAVCDGVADAAGPINSALANASSNTRGIVRISIYGADCLLLSSINLPSQVTLEGSGRNGSFGLNYTPATGSAVTTTSGGANKMSAVRGLLIKQPNSIAPIINFVDCHTCIAENNWLIGGSGVGSIGIQYQGSVTTATITAITKAASAVVTATNTFSNGDSVFIQSVAGMTQINGLFCTVASVSGSGFTCSNINSSGFSVYSSGGTATRLTGDAGLPRAFNNYIGLVYYGILIDGNANSGMVGWNRIQPVVNGTCYYNYSSAVVSGFPNQMTYQENTCETPNAGVQGLYIGPTTTGINAISNRFEGASISAIVVATGAAKVGLLNNYYSVATKITDANNVASGDDEAINAWIAYTPTVVSCTGGSIPTSTFNFKYKRINRNTTIVGGTQSVSNANTCTTGMTISLPNTTNSPGAGSRVDANTGASTNPLINTSSTSFFVFGTPTVTTYNYLLTYENQ